MKIVLRFALLFLLLLIPWTLYAQATTGNIIGTVTSQGKPLSGVTVTVASPSLQGTRTTISGDAGGYNFPSLPPGEYTASFELSGMQAARKRVDSVSCSERPADDWQANIPHPDPVLNCGSHRCRRHAWLAVLC